MTRFMAKTPIDASDWRQAILGEWPAADRTDLYKLAEEYHTRCDAFDIQVCGNPEGRPTNGPQFAAINRHSKQVLRELEERQRQTRIDGDLLKEIRRQSRTRP